MLAEADGKVIGAVWCRIMNDYGYVADEMPSLANPLFKEYRGYGIGTDFMRQMLSILKERGYKQVSLSVQKENYAWKMHLDVGFVTIKETDEEYIMVCELKAKA